MYQTAGGRFVCHRIERTRWEGEHDHFSGKVCQTLEEVRQFFGHCWLAKKLYDAAGVEDIVAVE